MSGTRELHGIFADNLRILASGERSVSELCRELGINRTQFNRYLSGQASPRPEALQRICTHFGVDGRILLEPLRDLADPHGPRAKSVNAIFDYLYGARDLLALRRPPPVGIHRYWQRSSLSAGWVNSYTVRLFRQHGAMMFRALKDRRRDGSPALPGRVGRDIRGCLMDQEDGIVMQAFQPEGKRLSFGVLSYPALSDSQIYPGVVMISRPAMHQASRVEPCALELLPQGPGLMPALRGRGGRWIDQLSDELHAVMSGDAR
ncbi:XRE family transcriptional regulator [Aliiroseovarius sp.]|uniref:helix-turn-helix domain-containing protein n=1 Tax=Aliiroseovarius sp. TaxID=1872442 RepID=UPI0026071DC8|nr:XRE family transcriptional regulator [Aliiroseovarius sp.]